VRPTAGDPDQLSRPARLTLLGGFELICDGAPVAMPLSAQRVIAFLALSGRPQARAYVAGRLWTRTSEARAASAMRTAVWRAGVQGVVLRCDAGALALNAAVEVDVDTLARHAGAVIGGDVEDADLDRLMVLRDAGELLPGWYDDWVLVEQERVRQLRVNALERLCHALSAAGRHADAAQVGLAAIACDPLRESAHRALVAAHLAHGNAADALRQYAICRDLLARDLGLAPSAQLERLVAVQRMAA
jgi:DNA-binding SARP family transcriptional activator